MSLRVWNIWLADNAWAPALTHYYNLQLMSLPSLLLTHRVIKCFGLHKTQKGYLNRFWRRWRLVGWFLGRVNIPQYLNSMNLNVIRVQGREYAFENKFRWFYKNIILCKLVRLITCYSYVLMISLEQNGRLLHKSAILFWWFH